MRYATAETVKGRVPLDSLCHHLGIALGPDDHAVCPFHDDADPSFYLWYGSAGELLWWCQPCGFGGDQIDLIRRARGLGFADAVAELDLIADGLPPSAPRVRRARDPEADMRLLNETVRGAMDRAAEPAMDGYMSLYAVGYVAESDGRPDDRLAWDRHLRSLGWGVDDLGRVVFPYWDEAGALTGAKLRSPDGAKVAVPGSSFGQLYMSWLPRSSDAVVVCEGETDCGWTSFHSLQGSGVDVRGLPGANMPLSEGVLLHILSWPTVFLAFDGDVAGDMATERWRAALGDRHPDVRLCPIPEGRDVRSAGVPLETLAATALRL